MAHAFTRRLPACLGAEWPWKTRDALGDGHAAGRFVPQSVEYHPYVRLTIIDPPVADGFPVVGLLASRYENQLQCHAVPLFEHGVSADLDRGPFLNVRRIRRDSVLEESRSGNAVQDERLSDGGRRLGAPRRSSKRRARLDARDLSILGTAHSQHRVQAPKAVPQEHYVLHARSITSRGVLACARGGSICDPAFGTRLLLRS
jgi:hypothetical protein